MPQRPERERQAALDALRTMTPTQALAFLALKGIDYGTRQNLQNLSKREGLPRRTVASGDLIPWTLKLPHWNLYPALMLRALAKQQAGQRPDPRLGPWLQRLQENDEVIDYDPEQGFLRVPRRYEPPVGGIDMRIPIDTVVKDPSR